MSSSEVWYWTWSWRTVSVTSTRMARKPLEVSVTSLPVSRRTSAPKTCTPACRKRVVGLGGAEDARADAKSASPATTRLEHARQLGRVPLPVAVERHDEPGAVLAGQPVADAQRDAVPAVALEPDDVRAAGAGDRRRARPCCRRRRRARRRRARTPRRQLAQHGAEPPSSSRAAMTATTGASAASGCSAAKARNARSRTSSQCDVRLPAMVGLSIVEDCASTGEARPQVYGEAVR